MTSTAISGQKTKLYIAGTPGSALSITAITKAVGAVVTATNTLAVGDSVLFGAVLGMPEIASQIGIVTAATGTSFTTNIDSSGYASAGTTGTAAPQTFTKIGNVHDYSGFDGSATELDRTNFDSVAMENFPGLQDFGQFSFNMDVDDTDVGQIAMRAAKTNATVAIWKVALPSGKVRVFYAWIKKFSETSRASTPSSRPPSTCASPALRSSANQGIP